MISLYKKIYVSIPKPLYGEVKEYMEDLINHNWISKSCSAYSSPMVCVQKKEGTLRLSVDYQQLNMKTYAEHHPIPRIQGNLKGMGGNKWVYCSRRREGLSPGFCCTKEPTVYCICYSLGALSMKQDPI